MERFSQFTRERQYLHNVSPATLDWYKNSLKWLPSESPSQDELKDAVIRMREALSLRVPLCERLGFNPPARTLHAFRHTFAVNYIRRGGSVFHLQKVLGHSTLEMTRRYANLLTGDLQAVHERVSLLSK
jgi:integrase